MACQRRDSWTATGLVSAFLDLAIAYILLCASTSAFLVSKFLGFFGLALTCSRDGLFGNLQKRLIYNPIEKVSSVQLSVRNIFPFDVVCDQDIKYRLNLRLITDRDNSGAEIGGCESSCSSVSGRRLENVAERDLARRNEGRLDVKDKGIVHRQRSSLRRRRKCAADHGIVSSGRLSSAGSSTVHIDHEGVSTIGLGSVTVEPGDDVYPSLGDDEDQMSTNIRETGSQGFEMIETRDEDEPSENTAQKELSCDGNDKNTLQTLEQALEEEHTALAALYFELEKERSAAASAADEALAMILRLQKEKAAIEMESRQYRRMIEEKSAYDDEEMNILKEIIVRREREKHCLETEVEVYRNMISDENQQYQDVVRNMVNAEGERHDFSLDLEEDPVFMLRQLSESIDKKEIVKDKYSDSETPSVDNHNSKHTVGVEGDRDRQEQNYNMNRHQGMALKTIETHVATDIHNSHDGKRLKENGEDAHEGSVDRNMESRVYDIHVINGESDSSNGVRDNRKQCLVENGNPYTSKSGNLASKDSEICQVDNHPTSGRTVNVPDNSRRSSDMRVGLPPLGARKSKVPHLRRNSMSAADSERLKIDSEIEWLRERLRIVQEGREKLNFSVEHQERETLQLQILGSLASQLREIRNLTDPMKALNRDSFHRMTSKVTSKKRRCRSVPLEI